MKILSFASKRCNKAWLLLTIAMARHVILWYTQHTNDYVHSHGKSAKRSLGIHLHSAFNPIMYMHHIRSFLTSKYTHTKAYSSSARGGVVLNVSRNGTASLILWDFFISKIVSMWYLQGVTGGKGQTSGGCSLC